MAESNENEDTGGITAGCGCSAGNDDNSNPRMLGGGSGINYILIIGAIALIYFLTKKKKE
jgi:hypothetical protein